MCIRDRYSAFYGPVAYVFNKLFDKVPFIKNSNFTAGSIKKKFGILGEPGIIGFVLGLAMSLMGGYKFTDALMVGIKPVSYTHLDVYKRQMFYR